MLAMPTFKPAGYNSLSPYHVVVGADRYIDFLVELFGGERLRRYSHDNRVVHAEVRIDDTVVMLSEASEQYGANAPITHLYVDDVDQLYAKAIAAGCEPIAEPTTRPDDPDRRGAFRDPFGNNWSVATQMKEETS